LVNGIFDEQELDKSKLNMLPYCK